MHGRLKVRSTAEQAEAKRLERAKKLKAYKHLSTKVNSKRVNLEFDEEALVLTGEILKVNPDYYSLWNYRREVLQQFKKERRAHQMQEHCTRELVFLENCLPVNPKSYGIWHHRSWVMLFMPEPDWKKELHLCNVYLTHDERNFHCWDYRRFVVEHAKVSAEEEFEFTNNKIKENFSNYSSWHYRSKLLPRVHPHSSGDYERIEENALLKEFELVQNAFFTDPNDQSAWFYHRWLLGRAKDDLGVLICYMRRSNNQLFLYLLFNQPVKLETVSKVVLKFNESEMQGNWFNPFKNSHPSYMWIVNLDSFTEKVNLSVACEELDLSISLTLEVEQETWYNLSDQLQYVLRSELTAVHNTFLQNELESCQLLQEEEPDNKWTILTIVLLMRALNPIKYSTEVEQYLQRLSVVDPYRCEYYCDLDSKYKLENTIERHFIKFKNDKTEKSRSIDLQNMNLSMLYHMEHLLLMTEIDLSNNKLERLDDCNMLQCAQVLSVNNNKLVTIVKQETLNLPFLKKLSLNNNNIRHVACLKALLGCKNLKQLDIHNNPLTTLSNWRDEIKNMLPWLTELNGEQL